MRTLLLVLIVAFTMSGFAQKIVYGYDDAGNRLTRRHSLTIMSTQPGGTVTQFTAPASASQPTPEQSELNGTNEQAGLSGTGEQPFKETLFTGQTVTIFPNPTSGALAVEISNLQNTGASLELYDLAGKQCYSKSKLIGREEINLSNAPAGVYFLRITLDGKMEEWKIVKQ